MHANVGTSICLHDPDTLIPRFLLPKAYHQYRLKSVRIMRPPCYIQLTPIQFLLETVYYIPESLTSSHLCGGSHHSCVIVHAPSRSLALQLEVFRRYVGSKGTPILNRSSKRPRKNPQNTANKRATTVTHYNHHPRSPRRRRSISPMAMATTNNPTSQ